MASNSDTKLPTQQSVKAYVDAGDKWSYSTTPVDTGKKWIDGRPVYRVVVQGVVNASPAGAAPTLNHGIDGLTTSMCVVSAYTFMKIGNSNGTSQNGGQNGGYFEGTGTTVNSANLTSVNATTIGFRFGFGWGNTWTSTVLEFVY